MHTVNKHLITKVFLNLGDIYDTTVRKLLKFGIVDIRTVKSDYLVVTVMARSEHERIIGRRRSEPHVAGYALVGVYDRVYFDATLLLSGLGMSADTLENGIGEQRNGRGINDSKLLYPFFRTIASAVRGKNVLIGSIQVSIYFLEELL